ncbi:MAG: ester cyclase [Acidimicrobiales bacterium]
MATQPKNPADVARTIFEAVSRHELDAAVELVAEDSVDDFVPVGRYEGKAAIRSYFESLFAAFPDFAITVDRVVADDAAAVVQWRAGGTFTGAPFQGIEATGRRVEIRGVDVMEIADGRVTHNTIYYDGASFARQVGMLPAQGTTAERAVLSAFNTATRVRSRLRH